MKILFLNLPYEFPISRASRWPEKTKSGTMYYPYWLCYAAGVCIEQGHDVDLIDCIARGYTREQTVDYVSAVKPDYVVCETTTPTCDYDYETIRQIKKTHKDIFVILGGTHATALPEEVLEKCGDVDVVALHEYDFTINDVIENRDSISTVGGIAYRDSAGKTVVNHNREWIVDLDEVPWVTKVYEKFLNPSDYGYSLAESPMVQIFSSRGCPYSCNFCSYPQTFGGRRLRRRSIKDFVDELEYVSIHMPYIREIFVEDDTFTVDRKRVRDICREIIDRNLKITWSCNTRADLDGKTMRLMKRSGCRLLVVGFESGNQRVLDETEKGIKLSDSENFMKYARKYRLKVFGCFMIGLKGDDLTTIKETYRYAKKLYPDMVFFQQAVPFPGTEFYKWTKENDMLITGDYSKWLGDDGSLRCLVNYPYASSDKIGKLRDRMMSKYYFSATYITRTLLSNMDKDEFKRVVKAGFSYIGFRIRRALKWTTSN